MQQTDADPFIKLQGSGDLATICVWGRASSRAIVRITGEQIEFGTYMPIIHSKPNTESQISPMHIKFLGDRSVDVFFKQDKR